jgi:hypothetical protein
LSSLVWSPSLRNHPLWRYFCLFGCILFDTSRLFCTTKDLLFPLTSPKLQEIAMKTMQQR